MRIILEPLAYQYGVDLFYNGATASVQTDANRYVSDSLYVCIC